MSLRNVSLDTSLEDVGSTKYLVDKDNNVIITIQQLIDSHNELLAIYKNTAKQELGTKRKRVKTSNITSFFAPKRANDASSNSNNIETAIINTDVTNISKDSNNSNSNTNTSASTIINEFNTSCCNSYFGIDLPKNWTCYQNSLLIYTPNDNATVKYISCSHKIAAFDFDGCLVDTSPKRIDKDAWKLKFDKTKMINKLTHLFTCGYKVVIFSNQATIGRATKTKEKTLNAKLHRFNAFLATINLPIQIFVSTCSTANGDEFRKPDIGMWNILSKYENCGLLIDKSSSFFVGDAAGRVTDHSNSDLMFAKNVGIRFYQEREYFLG